MHGFNFLNDAQVVTPSIESKNRTACGEAVRLITWSAEA